MSFHLAHLHGAALPRIVEKPTAAGADFKRGSLLVVNGTGQYAECAANPAAVAAISESGAGPDTSGFNPLGSRGFPPGSVQGCAVADEVKFEAEYVGALPAVTGGSFGVVRGADGKWRVDFANITNLVVRFLAHKRTESPINYRRVVVTFVPGVVQLV
jgi:hypothetical protein